jgi:hypothetical protein
MQAAHIAPGLPGISASRAAKGTAMLFGALVLVGYGPLMLLSVSPIGARGGHLPWPALQWAVTTPAGALVLMALCILVLSPSSVLLTRSQFRREVAGAIDLSGVLFAGGPGALQMRPQRSRLQRWLGSRHGEQALSVALLVLGTLLAIALVGAFLASSILWRRGFGDVRVQCDTSGSGCPPTFSLMVLPIAGWVAATAVSHVVRARWLRRIEATSHVWLRYRTWVSMAPLYYVRPPGVTPEVAAAALARFSSTRAVPFARRFFIGVLVMTPYGLLVSASFFLSAWLQLQWIPG